MALLVLYQASVQAVARKFADIFNLRLKDVGGDFYCKISYVEISVASMRDSSGKPRHYTAVSNPLLTLDRNFRSLRVVME